jgi:hypothetical protein
MSAKITMKRFEFLMGTVVALLAFFVTALVVVGDRTVPVVLESSVSNGSVVHGSLSQLSLTFNRSMNHKSVEGNIVIQPNLKGTFTWRGDVVYFHPEAPFQYETKYELKLKKGALDAGGKPLPEDFVLHFHTPAYRFAYIGTEDVEKGKLVISYLGGLKNVYHSFGDLTIGSFQICPDGTCIYALAHKENLADAHDELYQIFMNDVEGSQPFPSLKQITNGTNYLNKSFQLSPDGKKILLSRITVSPKGEYLTKIQNWIASTDDFKFERYLEGEAVGTKTLFTPDSSMVLYRNADDNFELMPVEKPNVKDKLFVGYFSELYAFHPFEPLIAFMLYPQGDLFSIKNSLVLYHGDGTKETVPYGDGLVRDTLFTPNGKKVISIFSKPEDVFDDVESFYPLRIFHLYSFDLQTKKIEPLTADFDFSEEQPTVSADGKYLVFVRYETFTQDLTIDPAMRDMAESLGNVQEGGQLWFLDLETGEMTSLKFKGKKPAFLP